MKDNVKKFREIAEQICNLYEKKNEDYDDVFSKVAEIEMCKGYPYGTILAKSGRLESILKNKGLANFEGIDDTIRDLAAYCIMTIMVTSNSTIKI